MTIEVRCSCGQKLSAKAEAAGRVLKCPICRRPLVVPDIRQEASAGDSNDTGDSPPTNHDLTKSGLRGWARPCQLIFLAFVFSFLQTMVVPPAAILFALAIVLYSVVLLVKRDSQNKLFNALGVADPTKRYAVLGMTNFFTVVTCVTVLLHWESIPDYEVPEYTVIEEIARIDGVKHVDVLIPSYSWDTPIEQRVQVARSIAYLEGYDQGEHTICLFSDRVAHKAQYSSSYAEQHPDHERGYLGSLENGEFSNWYEVERSSAVARDGRRVKKLHRPLNGGASCTSEI